MLCLVHLILKQEDLVNTEIYIQQMGATTHTQNLLKFVSLTDNNNLRISSKFQTNLFPIKGYRNLKMYRFHENVGVMSRKQQLFFCRKCHNI